MDNRIRSRLYVRIDGIYCDHCVNTITYALGSLEGISRVRIEQNIAEISGENIPADDVLIQTIRDIGYETDESRISEYRFKIARNISYREFLIITGIILMIALLIRSKFGYNVFNAIPVVDSSISYAMLFVTGLLTSIHCISMCGAISIYASTERNSVVSIRRPLLYNTGRVISYTVIGGTAGLIGSAFSINLKLRGIIILAAAGFMLALALSMLGFMNVRIPHFINVRTGRGTRGAFCIGLLNGLMPCGPLQAMQLYALSTENFFIGALSMALFALGTVPLMLVSGAAIDLTRGKARIVIGKTASVLMLILALSMFNRGLLSLGVDVTGTGPSEYEGYIAASVENGIQIAEFDLEFDSFADLVVQKGIPARITVHADQSKLTGCNNEIVSKDFDFDVPLSPGDNIIEFTPEEEGDYVYTCWMNMISNHIRVVDDVDGLKGLGTQNGDQ